MKNRLLDRRVKQAMMRTVYTFPSFPSTIAHFWVPLIFLGQGTCWLICKLTRGKIEHWFVTHTCYQFCKRNTIQQISSLYIHKSSLLSRQWWELSILSLLSLQPLHTSECRWFFFGQGTCWLICKLTMGKIEHWFVTHTCYQFCKRNTIQQISSLCIHRCSVLAPLGLRRWQVSAQKIPIASDKCKLAKNQECLAMSRCAWFVSAKTAAGR